MTASQQPGATSRQVDRLLWALGVKTITEAARALDVPERTARYWAKTGRVPLVQLDRVAERQGVSRKWLTSGVAAESREPAARPTLGIDAGLSQAAAMLMRVLSAGASCVLLLSVSRVALLIESVAADLDAEITRRSRATGIALDERFPGQYRRDRRALSRPIYARQEDAVTTTPNTCRPALGRQSERQASQLTIFPARRP